MVWRRRVILPDPLGAAGAAAFGAAAPAAPASGLHQPLGDGCLGDRFTQSRNLDLDGHDYNSSFLLALNRQ
jgi:hypothetical protein